jgi:Ca2+-binding RTX toxin-like protein
MRAAAHLGVVAAVAVTFCATVAAPAAAGPPVATLTMTGEMHYEAAAGQANHVVISIASPGVYSFSDVVPITYATPDGSTCSYPYPGVETTVHCVHGATFLDVKTYDLDDTIDNRTTSNMHAFGGDGNDVIRLGGKAVVAAAGDAAGEGGNDVIHSGPGDDYISGGPGIDTVTYQGRTAAVTASLLGGGGGAPSVGEEDVYFDLENLTGGGAGDTLTGNNNANVIDGGWYTTPCSPTPTGDLAARALAPPPCTVYSGNDTIHGNGGSDTLRGRQGADIINGGDGSDTLYGDSGLDNLNGGPSSDVCYPGADGATTVSCAVL